MTTITCPGCGRLIDLPDEELRLTIECAVCDTRFQPDQLEEGTASAPDNAYAAPAGSSRRKWVLAGSVVVAIVLMLSCLGLWTNRDRGGTGQAPEVTAKEIETFGKELVDKRREMVCKFINVSDTWVRQLMKDDRLVGFTVKDRKGDFFQYVFADKEKYGRDLVKMERGTSLRLIGTIEDRRYVVEPNPPSDTPHYVFMVEEISK